MNTYKSFFKKEIMESWRTFKLPLLLLLFIFLGLLNPFTALLTPEILELTMGDYITIQFPDPTSIDSWMQFYKNIPQLGLIIFIIVYSTIVNKDIGEHTLINIVTKGARRSSIILAKFTSLVFQWTIYLMISFIITWAYTLYYFQDNLSHNIIESAILLWVLGIVLIGILILGSTIINNNYGGPLFVGGIFIILLLWNFFDYQAEWNPIQLGIQNINLVSGELEFGDFYKSISIGIILCIMSMLASVNVFKRKEL